MHLELYLVLINERPEPELRPLGLVDGANGEVITIVTTSIWRADMLSYKRPTEEMKSST